MSREQLMSRIVEYARSCGQFDPEVLRDGFELIHLHRMIEQLVEENLAEKGISLRLVEIMECLFHHPDGVMTPADLSEEVNLSRSAMTSALDSLEKLGYAMRRPHPVDRRMFEISLTESGRSFIGGLLPERYEKFIRIMEATGEEERAMLLRTYHKIFNMLKAELA
ncbi:MAG: MarR family transcriptional regulator, partial [Lentisphaeria bacterium]|jgi:MarR family 2-MHQ and catechol resistance regulon transcriptional repressor|nr:MarR family transcriptional regulator [Lentisphaeria bacterium]